MPANLIRAAGLVTFSNELSTREGSLVVAENVNVDEQGVITGRRGFSDYGGELGSTSTRLKQILRYKERLLRHYDTTLEFDNGSGTFTAFNGTFSELEDGLRIKFQEANGNLYFTTTDGIKKVSISNVNQLSPGLVEDAGGIKAVDTSAAVKFTVGGFIPPKSKVAYRVVFGKRDNNNNLILGAPSARYVLTNSSETSSANADVTFTLPSTLTTDFFYQIYRTAIITASGSQTVDDIDPGDEMNLVDEAPITAANITAEEITVEDLTPESFRASGAPLYTNAITGQGILQANEPPPIAKDIQLFRGSTFYANTKSRHRQQFNLLSVADFTSGTSEFIIGNSNGVSTYTFVGETEVVDITPDTKANTASGSWINLYSANDERQYYLWFDLTGSDVEPSDPSIENATGIQVDLSSAVSAADVNQEIRNALLTIADFNAVDNSGDVRITWTNNGNVTDVSFGVTAPGGSWAINVITQGDGEDTSVNQVLLSGLASAGQAIDETARSLIRVINKDANSPVNAYYLSGADDLPGIILFESKVLTDDPFYLATNDSNLVAKFIPELALVETVSSLVSSGTSTNIEAPGHNLITGDSVYVNSPDTTPTIFGAYEVTVVDVNNFTIDVDITGDDLTGTNAFYYLAKNESDNLESPNRLYYSKTNQPDAVPIVNFVDVGPKDEPIERILALRDNLFVLKTDGVYVVNGVSAPNFSVRLLDSTEIIAPDSAVVLNNQIYMLSTQGVTTVTDSGVGIISRPIEDRILGVANSRFDFRLKTFGVAYESDRSYFIWLPEKTSDTVATQCYRFNTFERAWTRWTVAATCGRVSFSDDKLYLGSGDRNFMIQERKNGDRTDFADRDFTLTLPNDSVNGTTLSPSTTVNLEKSDVIVQSQYVPLTKFNRLLRKLDIDPGLDDTDYESTLKVEVGGDLVAALDALNAKLLADDGSGTVTARTFSTNSQAMQDEFNDLILELNTPACDTLFINYKSQTDIIDIEAIVTSVDNVRVRFEIAYAAPFIEGDFKVYKHIKSEIQWSPQHFGDPSALKQIREGTIIFDQNNFYDATVAYSSDLSAGFVEIPFLGKGVGYWGSSEWGRTSPDFYWGGDGNDIPFRTIIPREKQRGRYLNVRFNHDNAREKFRILGISAVVRSLSTRAYR